MLDAVVYVGVVFVCILFYASSTSGDKVVKHLVQCKLEVIYPAAGAVVVEGQVCYCEIWGSSSAAAVPAMVSATNQLSSKQGSE